MKAWRWSFWNRDAAGHYAAFENAGISASPVMHFEREGERPDGSAVKMGFSLAFAEDRSAPENFWNPEFQRHGNGATGIAEAIVVSHGPSAYREMLFAFTGAAASTGRCEDYTIALPRGHIGVTTPAAFAARNGASAPEPGTGARIAALRFDVANLTATEGGSKARTCRCSGARTC